MVLTRHVLRGAYFATLRATATMSQQQANSISTSSYGMVKAIEELEKNPYFEKYAGKIARFQK